MRSANCNGAAGQAVLPRSRECSRPRRMARALVLNRAMAGVMAIWRLAGLRSAGPISLRRELGAAP
jgi:hypothetical protein